jgi:hypothetical protein
MVRQAHHPEQGRRANLKFQFSMFKTLDFDTEGDRGSLYISLVRRRRIGHCDLFVIWDLSFGI